MNKANNMNYISYNYILYYIHKLKTIMKPQHLNNGQFQRRHSCCCRCGKETKPAPSIAQPDPHHPVSLLVLYSPWHCAHPSRMAQLLYLEKPGASHPTEAKRLPGIQASLCSEIAQPQKASKIPLLFTNLPLGHSDTEWNCLKFTSRKEKNTAWNTLYPPFLLTLSPQ